MKKLLTSVALVIATSSPSALVTGGTTELPQLNLFEMLDIDQDGVISQKEASEDSNLIDMFSKVDSNGDQKLTKEEYEQYLAASVKKSG